ncbi:uncharacterized protein LOC143543627 [Bidens hawaiensis]|uniref:uncharacterized protein LOC143543627 n=1 Tax=Bidens hawaiensis TaxID=980011 RepID=UPI00404B6E2E
MGLTSLQVCMDSPDWFQGTIPEEIGITDSSSPSATTDHKLACSQPLMERRLRPPQDQPLKCPRCDSTHTKFCYYNNYSLTQPRYFCKACHRYWTKGGTLRNIPIGGRCRKTKKVTSNSKKSTSASATASASIHHHPQNLNMININPNPNHQLIMNSRDLQLSYPETSMQFSGSNLFGIGNASNNNIATTTSFMFENLSGGGSQFIGMGGVNHHVINQSYQGGNLCSPFGGMTLDSINNPFSQRGLITYNHNENDVKPNLLALEWQDNDDNINTGVSATSGGGNGGYMTGLGSSWGGLVHGYGPSTTNPLV